jgi:hypothetical protein
MKGLAHISVRPTFKPGDLPPPGYLDWHQWADVQRKAGIKQVECGRCSKWKTPQELSGMTETTSMRSKRGPVVITNPICSDCAGALQDTGGGNG